MAYAFSDHVNMRLGNFFILLYVNPLLAIVNSGDYIMFTLFILISLTVPIRLIVIFYLCDLEGF